MKLPHNNHRRSRKIEVVWTQSFGISIQDYLDDSQHNRITAHMRGRWTLTEAVEFEPGKFFVEFPAEVSAGLPSDWKIKFLLAKRGKMIVLVEAGPLDASWLQRNADNLRIAADVAGRMTRRVIFGDWLDV